MASDKIKALTDANFGESVKTGTVLVDFWAEWCMPCRRLEPTVDELASDYAGRVTVVKLNIDENPHTPTSLGVRGIPTLMLFKDGAIKESFVGLVPKDQIARGIDKHL